MNEVESRWCPKCRLALKHTRYDMWECSVCKQRWSYGQTLTRLQAYTVDDRTHQPGDIVIIETRDFRAGDVRVPALIRYYEPEFDAYEVSVLLHPYKDAPADMDDLRWWTVKAHEIVANLGPAVTERPHKKMSGERVWRSFIFAPEEEL